MSVDPYQVLGIPRNATDDEIKKKYRALVKQYHPDLHPDDPVAAKKMSEINEAYEMIKSGQYDPYGSSSSYSGGQSYGSSSYGQSTGGQTYYSYGDMDDFLNSFFGAFGFGTAASQMDEGEAYEKISRYIAEGDFSSAASILNRMVMRGGKWYYYAAQVSSGTGDYASAIQYADAARRSDPSDPDYAELSARYHKQYDHTLRMRRIIPTILSGITILLVLSFVLRMILSFFASILVW
ncbi:DnaJ domain-containing protein [Huintestinicola sp.]